MRGDQPSSEGQRQRYLEGHRRNPLTTTNKGGRILSGAQLPWFTLVPPHGFGVLTTTGRKTGKRRRKCVRAIRDGQRVYVVSLKGAFGAWFRNLQQNPEVALRIRGGFFRGRAREIVDSAELDEARRVYVAPVNSLDWIEYRMHRSDSPTEEKIRAMHEKWFNDGTPVVIELSA